MISEENVQYKPACGCSHCQVNPTNDDVTPSNKRNEYLAPIISFVLLTAGLVVDHFIKLDFFDGYARAAWYLVAFGIVAFPVLKEALEGILKKDFFNEFTLMSISTVGAFFIGQYPEGVAVMLFYTIGELFQSAAVNKAQRNIKALLDIRPDKASVKRMGRFRSVAPQGVKVGEVIQVKVGEKVPLDGKVISSGTNFDAQALTGESVPVFISEGENALAGMVNLEKVVELKVIKKYNDSALSRILNMVQSAANRKAKTELLITRFARIYTPLIFFLALLITLAPALFVSDYLFKEWLYRGLVFLVISCPCALVVSIPLGYFGGIGAASRYGILFKGANFIDTLCKVNTVVFDKTGTLTKGTFRVQKVNSLDNNPETLLQLVKALEQYSTHPVAKAIMHHRNDEYQSLEEREVKEIAGHGLKGLVGDKEVVVGNSKLFHSMHIAYDQSVDQIAQTTLLVAINDAYAGYITVADELKEDAIDAIKALQEKGISQTVILSGDKDSITQSIASKLGISKAYGNLLPEGKVAEMEKLKSNTSNTIAFIGDGINDTPVLALSDVGIAMGGIGSDAAIETADVVIQTDHPSKVATAIAISKATQSIVKQNIWMAFGVKAFVLVLGGIGLANMWEAVFADVGVALLAILNAVRILNKKF